MQSWRKWSSILYDKNEGKDMVFTGFIWGWEREYSGVEVSKQYGEVG